MIIEQKPEKVRKLPGYVGEEILGRRISKYKIPRQDNTQMAAFRKNREACYVGRKE